VVCGGGGGWGEVVEGVDRSGRWEATSSVSAVRSERVPAAVVWGAADRFQRLAYGQRLVSDLHADLQTVEGGKHFVPEDHPREIAQAIGSVLERAS
jgi:pimeloyl-ACP methyl ester carboxylesterase